MIGDRECLNVREWGVLRMRVSVVMVLGFGDWGGLRKRFCLVQFNLL